MKDKHIIKQQIYNQETCTILSVGHEDLTITRTQ